MEFNNISIFYKIVNFSTFLTNIKVYRLHLVIYWKFSGNQDFMNDNVIFFS